MTTSSIIAAGGGDYTTITAWEAAATLTSSEWRGEINDTSQYSEAVVMAANGTTTLKRLILDGTSLNRPSGVWDTGKARITTSTTSRAILVQVGYGEVRNFQIENTQSTNANAPALQALTSTSTINLEIVFENLIVRKNVTLSRYDAIRLYSADTSSTPHAHILRNVYAYHEYPNYAVAGQNFGIRVWTDSATTVMSVALHRVYASANLIGLRHVSTIVGAAVTIDVIDSIFYGATQSIDKDAAVEGFTQQATWTGSNNIGNTAHVESLFSASYDSVTFTASTPVSGENVWVNSLTSGSFDLRLAGINAYQTPYGNGTAISGLTTDIAGTTIGSPPDIGPYELIPPPSVGFQYRPLLSLGVGA